MEPLGFPRLRSWALLERERVPPTSAVCLYPNMACGCRGIVPQWRALRGRGAGLYPLHPSSDRGPTACDGTGDAAGAALGMD